jgi:hypothetical protein
MFAWLISHQTTVLFFQNKPATSDQSEPANSTLLLEQTSTSHQPPANRTGCKDLKQSQAAKQDKKLGGLIKAHKSLKSNF